MRIVINGRTVETDDEDLSYDQLITIACGHNLYRDATVTYKSSDDQGSLTRGESVEIEDGMIFNVVVTGSS
jgi:hypothetical protein